LYRGKLETQAVLDLIFFVSMAKAVSGFEILRAVFFKQETNFANFLSHPTNSKHNQ